MVKKLIVRTSLSEVERIGLIRIAVTVVECVIFSFLFVCETGLIIVFLLVNLREKTLAQIVECVIFSFLLARLARLLSLLVIICEKNPGTD